MNHLQMIPSQGGNPIENLTEVGEMMKKYISSDSDSILEATLTRMNQQPSVWRKIIPSAFDREQKKIALDLLRTAYKDRRAFIDCFVATQLEITRRRGDALVMATSLDLQSKLAAFATVKMDEFTETILRSKTEYYAKSAAHWRSLEQYRDVPPIFERACQSCDREISAYLEWVETLRQKFTDALTAKVAEGGAAQ